MSILLAACLILSMHDGDTLKVQCPKRVHPIVLRVSEIDAPEFRAFTWATQPGAPEALAHAQAICPVGSTATVRLASYLARTSRWAGHIACSGVDLSHEMVASGNAWSYLPDKKSTIPALQAAARAARRGLWAAGNPIPPSEWRKGRTQ